MNGLLVPLGALIQFVQKGIYNLELETNLSNVTHTLLKFVSSSRYWIPFCTSSTRASKGTRFLSIVLLLILASCPKVKVECANSEKIYQQTNGLIRGQDWKTYNGDKGIFEVCWNKKGCKVAAYFANKKVYVFDVRL